MQTGIEKWKNRAFKTEPDPKVVKLFADLGTAPVIDEKLMDAATVLAASGTVFALRYIRASMQAGIEIGFDWQTAPRNYGTNRKRSGQNANERTSAPRTIN
ncbi:pyrroline-5-carboxylate reductase [Flavobacterium sp. 28A]|nr:pyrroline-5-carboxylate reductase [Flavobacterium sp. 28A]